MKNTWGADKWHEDLRKVVAQYRGAQLEKAEIDYLIGTILDIPPDWKEKHAYAGLRPSDHCSNRTNDGDCDICAGTSRAIFEYVSRATYLVK
jgi:hypothetical protein